MISLKKILAYILPALLFLLSLVLIPGCRNDNEYLRAQGMIWNTTYHITFRGPAALADSVALVLEDVGKSLNVFDSTSLVSRVNRVKSLPVDHNFVTVYNASRKIHEASAGLFDPTLSPLITAWGFGKGHAVTADTIAVDSVLQFVGLSKTSLNDGVIYKDDIRTCFNFSAIAKGYGCDQVGEMLKRNGVEDYLVEIGGEIAASGKSPSGKDWRISIDRPITTDSINHDSGAIIEFSTGGLATSGNYRNFHKVGDKNVGHTISPLTGRPALTDVLSVTVLAPSCMEADAAATACMAAGIDKAIGILEKLSYEGMLVKADSSVWMTEGFKRRLVSAKSSEPGKTDRN